MGRRAGAVTVGLDIWHLDVPEFLEMQTENGDQRRKCYDVFPQLILPDEFMRRVVNKETWTLVDPYEVRENLGIELAELWGEKFEKAYQLIESELGNKITLFKQINARHLFKEVMQSQVETGMPYLAFKDTINRANPNNHEGIIPQTNLCCESYSNVTPNGLTHCCNLTSINLANTEFEEIPYIAALAVRLLDNTIEITTPPVKGAKAHNDRYRTIGVGMMGLADYMAKNQKKYNDLTEINRVFEEIAYHCTLASANLAKERGSYAAFCDSQWEKGDIQNILPNCEKYLSDPDSRWSKLRIQIMEFGIRNSHITAIAPNTSSSKLQGCSASILPVYKRFFYDKNGKGFDPISVAFPKYWWHYAENFRLNQSEVVKVTSTIQKWIDTGISMELLFNLNEGVYWPDEPERSLTAKDIFETLIMAWEKGCKAIYYIRSVQKDSFKDSCESCAN
jgi:ribonucleoside-diphosphate reductase alpha chain